jgi:hypothetical protein
MRAITEIADMRRVQSTMAMADIYKGDKTQKVQYGLDTLQQEDVRRSGYVLPARQAGDLLTRHQGLATYCSTWGILTRCGQ